MFGMFVLDIGSELFIFCRPLIRVPFPLSASSPLASPWGLLGPLQGSATVSAGALLLRRHDIADSAVMVRQGLPLSLFNLLCEKSVVNPICETLRSPGSLVRANSFNTLGHNFLHNLE